LWYRSVGCAMELAIVGLYVDIHIRLRTVYYLGKWN